MTILIIDDDKLTINTLMHILEDKGHQVSLAKDGEEAISLITNGQFDLIISDIMMPGISGLSLVNVLRAVHLCTTPIIMMSTLSNKPLLEAAMEAGANDFIQKPFTVEEIDRKLEAFNKTAE
jgi:CheY-like chemotaxis protein